MSTRDFIVCAVFVSGAAVFYDTKDVCTELAANIDGAKVQEVRTFADIIGC